jgi:hypothetical protein
MAKRRKAEGSGTAGAAGDPFAAPVPFSPAVRCENSTLELF